jgi:hypothetical protein
LTCSLCIILIKIGGRGILHILILTSYLLHWIWPWCKLKVSSGLGVVTPSSTTFSKPSTTPKITSSLRCIILPLALLTSTTTLVAWTIACKVAHLATLMTRPRSILVSSTNFHGLAMPYKHCTHPCLNWYIRWRVICHRDWEIQSIRLPSSRMMSLLRDALVGGCVSSILGVRYSPVNSPGKHGSLSKVLLDVIQIMCCKLEICVSCRLSPNTKGLNNLWINCVLH